MTGVKNTGGAKPRYEAGDTSKRPLIVIFDGSGPFPLDMAKDNLLSHFQSSGFVAAMIQKRGIKPSQGEFNKLTYEERIQDNLCRIRLDDASPAVALACICFPRRLPEIH